MSWIRIWIHVVFCTKYNQPYFVTSDLRSEVFRHIKENAQRKDILLDSVNGYKQHVHCLISLKHDQSVSKIVQLIKGESSFWINKNKLIRQKFMWQDDYWAVGISESHLHAVRKYIFNQEDHHRKRTFMEEVSEFMDKYGWRYVQGG